MHRWAYGEICIDGFAPPAFDALVAEVKGLPGIAIVESAVAARPEGPPRLALSGPAEALRRAAILVDNRARKASGALRWALFGDLDPESGAARGVVDALSPALAARNGRPIAELGRDDRGGAPARVLSALPALPALGLLPEPPLRHSRILLAATDRALTEIERATAGAAWRLPPARCGDDEVLIVVGPEAAREFAAAPSGAGAAIAIEGPIWTRRAGGADDARCIDDLLHESGTRRLTARLASTFPVPGGGAAAARAGQMAAALLLKVVHVSRRRGQPSPAALDAAERDALALLKRLEALENADQAGFLKLLEAYRLPRDGAGAAQERQRAIESGAREALEPPLATLQAAQEILDLTRALAKEAESGALAAESDLGVAAELARAAFDGSIWNVRINRPLLPAGAERDALLPARIDEAVTRFEADARTLRGALLSLVERSPR